MLILLQSVLSHYRRIAAVILAATIVAGLFLLGAQPIAVNLIPSPWDKVAHGVLFALLAWGIGIASGLPGWRKILIAATSAVFVGMLDEWNQVHLPGRQAGLDDFAADVIGSIAGAILPTVIARWKICLRPVK